MLSLTPKLLNTIILALLFLVISSPLAYGVVNSVIAKPLLRTRVVENGTPTRIGLLLHSIVFGLLVYFIVLK